MLIPSIELFGIQLDYAVAIAAGYHITSDRGLWLLSTDPNDWRSVHTEIRQYRPTKEWSLAGPILDRCGIFLWKSNYVLGAWSSKMDGWDNRQVIHADDPLAALCQCYVTHRLGTQVEIPDNLPKVAAS